MDAQTLRTHGCALYSTHSYGYALRSRAALVPAQQGNSRGTAGEQQGNQPPVPAPSSGILGALCGLVTYKPLTDVNNIVVTREGRFSTIFTGRLPRDGATHTVNVRSGRL